MEIKRGNKGRRRGIIRERREYQEKEENTGMREKEEDKCN